MHTDRHRRCERWAPERAVAPKLLTLLAVTIALVSQPALSQGAMGPGGAAMAPAPRMAPSPAPQAPAFIPNAPVTQPGSAMNGAPQKQNPGYLQATPGTSNTAAPGIKANQPIITKDVDNLGVKGAAPLSQTSQSIFDRWGNLFAEQGSFVPANGVVVITTKRGQGALQSQTNQKGFFTLGPDVGQSGPADNPITAINITLPANPDMKVSGTGNSGSAEPAPAVLIALLLPAVQHVREAIQLGHAFPRSGAASKILVIIKRDGDMATVDWGDGSAVEPFKWIPMIPKPQEPAMLGRVLFVGGTIKY